MKTAKIACVALIAIIFGLFGQTAYAQSTNSEVEEFLSIMDQTNAEIAKCANMAEIVSITEGLDAKTSKFDGSKAEINEADRARLIDSFMNMIKGSAEVSMKAQGFDTKEPYIQEAINGQMTELYDAAKKSTADAKTLGEFIDKLDKMLNQ